MDDKITQTPEQIADRLQYLGLLPGPQKYYYQFLSSQAGLATSLGDLIDKIDDGTVTRNDYIDVLKDLGAISVSTVGLIALATGGTLPLTVTLGIGLGLAALDYADEHNYDASEIYEDLKEKMSMLENYMNGGEQDGGLDPTADSDNDGIPDYLDPFPDKPANPEGSVSIEVSNAVALEESAQVKVSLSSALKESIHMTFGISVKNHQIQKKVA